MQLYSQTQLADLFSGKLERAGLAEQCDLELEIEIYGKCLITRTPVKSKETGEIDYLLALYPKDLFWVNEPVRYVFLSDIKR